MKAIETFNLTKKYKDMTAVDHLNLAIEDGELYALLGVNGAGKTTTIKMLSCLITPTDGDAVLLGGHITKDAFKIKENINVSPQESAVAPNLSVRENLELICGIYGHSRKEARLSTTETIEAFRLGDIEHKKAKKLSGGWQRRLSIAMALISKPKILFLDEPTLGLDVLARRELWEVIQGLKGKVTMILTTHYLEEAQSLADHIGIMAKGHLVADGTVEEIIMKSGKGNFEDAFVALCGNGGIGA